MIILLLRRLKAEKGKKFVVVLFEIHSAEY